METPHGELQSPFVEADRGHGHSQDGAQVTCPTANTPPLAFPVPIPQSGHPPGRAVASVPGKASHPVCFLQVGEEARFSVTSTCPCNFTLHYEVAARGNIVLSGQQPAHVTRQRSRREALEKQIRLTHLSETGELAAGWRSCPSSAMETGTGAPERRGKPDTAKRRACLRVRARVPGETGLRPGWQVASCSGEEVLIVAAGTGAGAGAVGGALHWPTLCCGASASPFSLCPGCHCF